eukprot:CAMPEP_0171014986 /NCGR_PEP_ID=MMETSP0736-20130129/25564_1 /TAXON_ID=186038 /ORGANISM="Fragilariopsis kerguelensis, Strain L26-C5" /LENGTH=130 /DNA_ID=CAMNT_0011449537 /DNA_START=76 /DNA_END=468 /DNA_ORIENTATION=+
MVEIDMHRYIRKTLKRKRRTRQKKSIENSSERSALNISEITDESHQLIVVSPAAAKKNAPNRNHSILVTVPTAAYKVRPKQKRPRESGDRSELTTLTTGSGSQSEQHNPENEDKSKQNHDHQTGPAQQIH